MPTVTTQTFTGGRAVSTDPVQHVAIRADHQAAILAELQAARRQQALATFAAGQRRTANLLGLFLILTNVALLFTVPPLVAFTFPASLLLAIGVVIWQGITRRLHAAKVARDARASLESAPR